MEPLSIRAEAVTPERITLAVALRVHNPNSFALSVQDVTGRLALGDGAALGAGSSKPRVELPAEANTQVALTLELPWQNLSALAPYALSGVEVPYRFDGTARLGGKQLNTEVPFALEGKLTRAQVLQLGLRGLWEK